MLDEIISEKREQEGEKALFNFEKYRLKLFSFNPNGSTHHR
jgi:hypothetical protein